MRREVVVAEGLVKRYTSYERKGIFRKEKKIVEALKGVSFTVLEGQVFGLLGPNGAGKTTTVKILSTLLIPDAGRASVYGYDVVREARNVRELIGVSLSVEKGFFWKLTGRENLTYFGMLYGLGGSELRNRVDTLLELVGLKELEAEDKLYEEYSLGMKARLSLARALLTDPPVLILDEPTLGLDPPSARMIRELLVELAHKHSKTVFVTTHNMFEAEMICDKVVIIDKGKVVAAGTVSELKRKVSDKVTVNFTFISPRPLRPNALSAGYPLSIDNEERGLPKLRVVVPASEVEDATARILRFLYDNGCSVRKIEVKEPTLEDVFILVTGRGGRK